MVYQEVNVAADKQAREELVRKSGQMVVPVIEVDGEIGVGYNEGWLKEKLKL